MNSMKAQQAVHEKVVQIMIAQVQGKVVALGKAVLVAIIEIQNTNIENHTHTINKGFLIAS